MIPLQVLVLVFVALLAVAVVLVRDPLRQILVISVYGFALAVLFLIFQAPDVALSMIVVGGIAYPLIVLVAIARVRDEPYDPSEEERG